MKENDGIELLFKKLDEPEENYDIMFCLYCKYLEPNNVCNTFEKNYITEDYNGCAYWQKKA